MATEIEVIISDLTTALRKAESDLRDAKVLPPLPPRKFWTNLDEAKTYVRNALAYGRSDSRHFEHTLRTLVANLEKIQELLDDPSAEHFGGPHK